jgi:hypothetical protein
MGCRYAEHRRTTIGRETGVVGNGVMVDGARSVPNNVVVARNHSINHHTATQLKKALF